MEFRVVYLPPFRAASSGADQNFDFSPMGKLGKFSAYFSQIVPLAKDAFMPRDFLYYDPAARGMIWLWALAENMSNGGFEEVDFGGGLYLTFCYKDGDEAESNRLYGEALKYIEDSPVLETDFRENHYSMGHIITPKKVIDAQGWAQMETFIPVKLRA